MNKAMQASDHRKGLTKIAVHDCGGRWGSTLRGMTHILHPETTETHLDFP